MNENDIRQYYIDNLRTICILFLVPFHALMAWNCWMEGTCVYFFSNKWFSSVITLVSPWYMPLLFILAGISARYSLSRRTVKEFIKERFFKLFIPFIVGIVTIVPVMTYYADVYHNNYSGNFFLHYTIFFSRFTDLTGADGGWTPAHLWFLLYLFVISIVGVFLIHLQKEISPKFKLENVNLLILWSISVIVAIGNLILNIGGKSIGMYSLLFMAGYYIFYDKAMIEKLKKYRWLHMFIFCIANVMNVYLFIWCDKPDKLQNIIAMYVALWFGILAILGFASKNFNQSNRLTKFLSRRSFDFYIVHYMWLIILQFYFERLTDNVFGLLIGPIILTYVLSFVTVEIIYLMKKRILVRK